MTQSAILSELIPENLPKLKSHTLFSGTRLIAIEHAGQVYYLRITRQGKLILTK
jgi:hemin uptake protein HemP